MENDFHQIFFSGGPEAEPLSNFEIRVGISKDIHLNPMCGERVAVTHSGELWTSQCTPPLPGQVVSIHRKGNVFLTVCEVAVYARQGWYPVVYSRIIILKLHLQK